MYRSLPRLKKQYKQIEDYLQNEQYSKDYLDVKPSRAFLVVYDDPQMAMEMMIDVLRLSKVVGHQYYLRTLDQTMRMAKMTGDMNTFIEGAKEDKKD